MAAFDFKCNKCGYVNEYNTSPSLPKSFHPPEGLICPECGKGQLEKQLSTQGQSFDIVGYCYMNEYGKHAWKKKPAIDQADVYLGKDPY